MKYVKKIKPFFIDDRGEMSHLIEDKVKIVSAILISSKKGSIRANHYHKKDSHYSYLLEGEMEYTYKNLKSKTVKKHTIIVKKGEMIYTPPMTAHAMEFTKDSVFIAFATEPRGHNDYEEDLARYKLV